MPTPCFDAACIHAARYLLAARARHPAARTLVAGVSGIDGSGKTLVTRTLVELLRASGAHALHVPSDPWLAPTTPGEGALERYERSRGHVRLLAEVVRPVADSRTLPTGGRAGAPGYRRSAWRDVDILLVDGNFLFRRESRGAFDLRLWVDCTAETATERLLAGGDDPGGVIARVTMPAQAIHLACDVPRAAAQLVFVNDVRLAPEPWLLLPLPQRIPSPA